MPKRGTSKTEYSGFACLDFITTLLKKPYALPDGRHYGHPEILKKKALTLRRLAKKEIIAIYSEATGKPHMFVSEQLLKRAREFEQRAEGLVCPRVNGKDYDDSAA